jgi:inosose dehydratase
MVKMNADKVRLGICPIGWTNDDMPELGSQNSFEQCVSEMALAGFTGCEIGGRYPQDTAVLREALDLRGLSIASCWFSSFLLTKPYEETQRDFRALLARLKALGAHAVNVSEQSYSIQGKLDKAILFDKYVMRDDEWDRLCDGLNRLGAEARAEGFRLCYHHHMGTVVQTLAETERLMENTDPALVWLCFDTGHFTFAGEDPVPVLQRYADRVGHVHLKNMRLPVVEKVRSERWSFLHAVRSGAFTVPGDPDGCVDFDALFELLNSSGYEGWVMVEAEQDPAAANPLRYAKMARAYLRKHAGL